MTLGPKKNEREGPQPLSLRAMLVSRCCVTVIPWHLYQTSFSGECPEIISVGFICLHGQLILTKLNTLDPGHLSSRKILTPVDTVLADGCWTDVEPHQLVSSVRNPDYLEHTKYKCLKKYEYYHFTDINILAYDARAMKDRPDLKFINTRSIGLIGGLFLRSQLLGIIETINHSSNPSRHYVYHIHNGGNSKISIKPIISATNVSWEVKPRTWTIQELDEWRVGLTEASRRPGNMVSSDHCADDESDNFLVTIASVKNKDKKKRKRELSSDGGKSKKQKAGRRKTKRNKHKIKKKTRRKRKNKKTKRRRRNK